MALGLKAAADGLSATIQVAGVDRLTVDNTGKVIANKFAGDGSELTGIIKSGTAINTTSGTAHDFTGIPSGVKRITVVFNEISTNGVSGILLQLGTSSGIENTGYISGISYSTAGGNSTSGMLLNTNLTAAGNQSGVVTLLAGTGVNKWVSAGTLGQSSGNYSLCSSVGSKTISGTLDRIRLTTVNGTDVFDHGSINILYE